MNEFIQIGPIHYAELRHLDNGNWQANIIALDEDGKRSIEDYTDECSTSQEALGQAKWYWQMMYGLLRWDAREWEGGESE